MFNFLLIKSDTKIHCDSNALKPNRVRSTASRYRSKPLLAATILAGSLLIGCQQQSTPAENATNAETAVIDTQNEVAPQSDSAAAHIKQLQPIYVEQMLSLQRRLQAEYESLQAADMSTNSDTLLLGDQSSANQANATDTNKATTVSIPTNSDTATSVNSNDSPSPSASAAANGNNNSPSNSEAETAVDTPTALNSSVGVGERDLTVLRQISAEPREPNILTEKQIIKSYQQSIAALYQPTSEPLNSEQTDALINIAALIPQLFEHTELADRLNAKSPALARLIVQHQVWEQIEARQATYMQEMKVAQQQEFETLMTKFNDTIKDYDEQIAKYEQTLQEFQ